MSDESKHTVIYNDDVERNKELLLRLISQMRERIREVIGVPKGKVREDSRSKY